MFHIDHGMHTDIFDPEQHVWDVHVIGCGGIGSQLALLLAKLGVAHIHFWDDDLVEPGNLAYQWFRPSDIGKPKAEALRDLLADFGHDNVTPHVERVDASTQLSGVVISGVDSMASRQTIWERVQWNGEVFLYIDLRIGGEFMEMFAINPCDPDKMADYEKTICSDDEAAPLPCSARAVVHPAAHVASLAQTQLVNFAKDRPVRWRVQVFGPQMELFAF